MPYGPSPVGTQVAAAAQPQDLGKRQRKKVSYNEAHQSRDRVTSASDSEYQGSGASEDHGDDDDENGASGSGLKNEGVEGIEGSKVGLLACAQGTADSTTSFFYPTQY